VRELSQLAKQLVSVYPDEAVIKSRFLPLDIACSEREPPGEHFETRRGQDLAQLSEMLERHGGNLSRACTELRISRQRAYRLLDGQSPKAVLDQRQKSRSSPP
jgi:transcriptional regulator with PAS, ATPase and Fis domain